LDCSFPGAIALKLKTKPILGDEQQNGRHGMQIDKTDVVFDISADWDEEWDYWEVRIRPAHPALIMTNREWVAFKALLNPCKEADFKITETGGKQ
jgi:hypothetical protein